MTRGTARFVAIMGLLMVLLGTTNFVLNGVGQWSSWVLVGLGTFSAGETWWSARRRTDGGFAFRWQLLVGVMLGGAALGVLLGLLNLGRGIEFTVLGLYVAFAVVLLLLRPARGPRPR